MLAFGAPSALAAFHGVAEAKSCTSPVAVGDPYTCTAQILNVVDTAHDTVRVSGLSDTVNAASGSVATGNILPSTPLLFTGAVNCTGGTGTGTAADPYIGATQCLLPFGSSIATKSFSHYTVQPADFNIPSVTTLAAAANAGDTNVKLGSISLDPGQQFVIDPLGPNPETRTATAVGTSGAGGTGVSFATPLAFAHAVGTRVDQIAHKLTDTVSWDWNNTCVVDPDQDCSTNAQVATAGASATVLQRESSTATQIHDAAHQVVTTVQAGSIVHDFVTVTGVTGQPNPTGTVIVDWFTNGTCSGEVPAASSGPETLNANGQVDATDFPRGPLAVGSFSFRARYLGDSLYFGSVGACEPLQVVDARITITPNGVNRVGQTHTFTAQVQISTPGSDGFVNAPAGTGISFTIDSGPGAFTSANPCMTVGNTGSCTINLSSSTTGVTTVSAHTTLSVGGIVVTRNTDGTGTNSGPAVKRWVNAAIAIAANATNEVGNSHTFTVTVANDVGDGNGQVAASGATVAVTLTDTNGANHTTPTGTCLTSTTDANGHCTITFLSNSAGTVTAHATTTLSVAGSAPFTISTDGTSPNSGDAVKLFVDANIQITPASANNAVGTNHTLTGHVNVNAGTGGGYVNAPAGTTIVFSILSGPGSFVGGVTTCTTVGTTGSCTAQITSPTTGTTTVRATTDVSVGGVTLHRATGDGKAGDSADALKNWGDDTVRTDILNAANGVVTTVQAGTVVHDRVQVQRIAGTPASVPNPTGTVIFHRYTTGDCTGTPTDQSVALTPGDPSTAVSADFAPTANMSYKADYQGDANYPAHTGACEPLVVTPVPQPAIAIVKNPKGQTVKTPGTARFTITVTNVGNTVLTNVTVTDPLSPNCNRTSAQIPALASMDPKASVTYSCSRPNVTKAFDNEATATGTPPTGPNVTASDTAPVKVRIPLVPKNHPKVTSHKKPRATG